MKYFLVWLQVLFFCVGCKKESTLINDTGAISNFQTVKIDSSISIGTVYETKNFAAFTDIAYFNGLWYTVFRVGTSHSGGEGGQIKILKSSNGAYWEVMDVIAMDNYDLRDPKLTIDSLNNDLYLSFFGKKTNRGSSSPYNYITKYDKFKDKWGTLSQVQYNNANGKYIFWRYTYNKGKMYSLAYRSPILSNDENNLCLFVSNGKSFTEFKSSGNIRLANNATETTLRFAANDSMYFISRTGTINSPIGLSLPSYTTTSWINNPFSTILASPNFLFYKNKMLITGRDAITTKFKFYSYDPLAKKIEKSYIFPSGHETGYGGMSFNPKNPDELWVSYYSISQGLSSIKLAIIDLKSFLQ